MEPSDGRAAPRSARAGLGRRPRLPPRLPRCSFALLPVLVLLLPAPAKALPAPAWYRPTDGLRSSRQLLEAANASLHRLKLSTLGFECTLEEVDLEDITKNQVNTIKACISEDPETGNCPSLERSTLDASTCLQGISEDLNAYKAELKNFSDHMLLAKIDEMTKVLRRGSRSEPQPPASTEPTSFKRRMRRCSILHAFRIRTITISRLMSYLSSPESSS